MGESIRCRLFQLVEDGKWLDKGTGFLYVKQSEKILILVEEENEEQFILHHVVEENVEYELQGNTIITWTKINEEQPMDWALSFERDTCCLATWEWICVTLNLTINRTVNNNQNRFHFNVPDPTTQNLEIIQEALSQPGGSIWLKNEEENLAPWYCGLYDVLISCEKLEKFEQCEQIFEILVELLRYGTACVTQMIGNSEENIIYKTFHIAEYHPHRKIKGVIPTEIRSHLQKSRRISLPNISFSEAIKSLTKRLFEITILRDVALLDILDENAPAYSQLNHQIYYCTLNVVELIATDQTLIMNLKNQINKGASQEDMMIILSFLHELVIGRCKSIQLLKRQEIMLKLVDKGLLSLIYKCVLPENIIPTNNPIVWRFVLEIVSHVYSAIGVTEMKQHLLIHHKISIKKEQPNFLSRLLDCLHQPCESGLLCQIIYIIRLILLFPNSSTPEIAIFLQHAPLNEISDVWRMFHVHYFEKLVTLLNKSITFLSPHQIIDVQIHIVGILKDCVLRHDFAMKHTILKYCLMQKVSNLITFPEKKNLPIPNVQLALACLRFFRACVNKADDFYIKRVSHKNVLENCVRIYCINNNTNNLLDSSFLSIIHPIFTRPNMKLLLTHVGEKYLTDLEKINKIIFKPLRKKYDALVKKNQTKEKDNSQNLSHVENINFQSSDDKISSVEPLSPLEVLPCGETSPEFGAKEIIPVSPDVSTPDEDAKSVEENYDDEISQIKPLASKEKNTIQNCSLKRKAEDEDLPNLKRMRIV